MKYIQLTVTKTIRYPLEPSHYEGSLTEEEMLAKDLDYTKSEPADAFFYSGAEIVNEEFSGEIIDDTV